MPRFAIMEKWIANFNELKIYAYENYILLVNKLNFANWVYFSIILSSFLVIAVCYIFDLIVGIRWYLGIFYVSSENSLSILGALSSIQATILSIFLAFYSVVVQIHVGSERDVRYVKNAFKERILLFITCIYILSIIIDLFTMRYVNSTNPKGINLFLPLTLAIFAILIIFPGIGILLSRLTNSTIIYEVLKKPYSRIDMAESNFSGINLQNKNLSRKNLSGSNLSKTSCIGTNFNRSNLQDTIFIESKLNNANFIEADLTGAKIKDSEFKNVAFAKAKLNATDINNTAFSRSKMRKVDFSGAKIDNSSLDETDLTDSRFNSSNIKKTNLSKANLRKTRLTKSNFTDVKLEEADLSESYLVEINLSGSELKGANLSNILLDEISLDQLILANGIRETKNPRIFRIYDIHYGSIDQEENLRKLKIRFLDSRRVPEENNPYPAEAVKARTYRENISALRFFTWLTSSYHEIGSRIQKSTRRITNHLARMAGLASRGFHLLLHPHEIARNQTFL